ncbi:hypothetical protein [Ammoniphilus sp. CFH 90114]|uniref:hypothetical protein n=1 Tax=Ammoniphilus sp. CFH 90114 TaxID=2493665 RepID=UPI00100D9DA3|nr:hypothetical protein [Ammoniphilus sp. CFH 90114]RXT14881.1 hypothetical protein EIZ39_01325 [Ammoniphilus sp. CFH 90114]
MEEYKNYQLERYVLTLLKMMLVEKITEELVGVSTFLIQERRDFIKDSALMLGLTNDDKVFESSKKDLGTLISLLKREDSFHERELLVLQHCFFNWKRRDLTTDEKLYLSRILDYTSNSITLLELDNLEEDMELIDDDLYDDDSDELPF